MQTIEIDYLTCKFCEKIYHHEKIYDLSDKKDHSGLMCIDCIYDIYYHLELS
jgi:hypothetical protein